MGLLRHRGGATGLMVAGALGATLLGGYCLRANADDAFAKTSTDPLRNATIDLELAGSPLPNAIRLVEQRTGASVVLVGAGDTTRFGTVTVSLKNRSIEDVLRLVATSAGADFWTENGIYYIGPKGYAPKPPVVDTAFTPSLAPDNGALPQEPRQWVKVQLQYGEPHQILHMLGADNTEMGIWEDLFRNNVLRMMLANQDPRTTGLFTPVTSPYQYIGGTPTQSSFVPTSGGLGSTTDLNSANLRSVQQAVGSAASSVDQGAHRDGADVSDDLDFGRGGQFGFGGGGQQGGFGGQQGGFGGQQSGFGQGGVNGQPGGGVGGIGGANGQANAASLLPAGVTPADIIALPNDNSIILHIPPAAEDQIRKLIRLLDVKPRQLMIKAEFVTVTQNDIDSFGINFQFQRVNLVGGTNTGFAGTSGQGFLQYATGNLAAQLSVALSQGHGKLVAAPSASTLNNMPVNFSITTTVPAFISTPIVTAGGTTVVSQTIVPIPVVTGLSVLPRINGDDSITIFGTAQASAVGAPITGPSGESYPNVTNQTAPIQRIIRNGDTMVIAGLNSKNDVITSFKVPLVGDLPLIGNLFRSRSITTNDSELLIFITPTIIQERVSNLSITGGAGPAPAGGGGGVLPAPGPGVGP